MRFLSIADVAGGSAGAQCCLLSQVSCAFSVIYAFFLDRGRREGSAGHSAVIRLNVEVVRYLESLFKAVGF